MRDSRTCRLWQRVCPRVLSRGGHGEGAVRVGEGKGRASERAEGSGGDAGGEHVSFEAGLGQAVV